MVMTTDNFPEGQSFGAVRRVSNDSLKFLGGDTRNYLRETKGFEINEVAQHL